jgi:hypothetical protein
VRSGLAATRELADQACGDNGYLLTILDCHSDGNRSKKKGARFANDLIHADTSGTTELGSTSPSRGMVARITSAT